MEMLMIQPIALTAEGNNTYKVLFQSETGDIEYGFIMDEEDIPLLISDDEFLGITNADPAAYRLKQSVCDFHQARCSKLQPIALTVESENAYRVRFEKFTGGEVYYTFTVSD